MDSAELQQSTRTTQGDSQSSSLNPDLSASYRDRVFRTALWSAVGFGGVAFWALFIFFGQKIHPLSLMGLILVYSGLVTFSALSKTSETYRAASLILLMFLQGAGSLIWIHHLAAASLFLFSCLMMTALLTERKAVYLMGFIALFTLVSGSVLLSPSLESKPLLQSPELSHLLTGFIYVLITASGMIPLIQYFVAQKSILDLHQQPSRNPEEDEGETTDPSDILTQPKPVNPSKMRKMRNLIAEINPDHPWEKISLQVLSWISQEYGYPHIEMFLTSGNNSCHYASIYADSNNKTNESFETILLEDVPDEVRKLMSGLSPLVKQETDISEDAAPSPENHSLNQASILLPLKTNQEVIGALLIHQIPEENILLPDIAEMGLLADFLALTYVNKRLTGDEIQFSENTHWVNQSIRHLSLSETTDEIYSVLDETLSRSSFVTIQFEIKKNTLHLHALNDPDRLNQASTSPMTINIGSGEGIVPNTPLLLRQLYNQPNLPGDLLKFLHRLNLASTAFLPIQPNNQISRLIILGSREKDVLTPGSIQPYIYLTSYTTTAIEKIITRQHLQRRVAALQSLASISQAISVVTDINELFDTIHEQVTQVVGEVDLAIALYDPITDMISIPYAHEGGQKLTLDPFPLGQGLTSILIRTQRPLMLVKDTERKARELGAKISGAAAKSWLGVPLIVSGEVLGAIILQDTQNEQRFTEDDLHLITTLASQVAITVRNVRLLQETNRRAERERIVANITSKIWSSPDIESIARNALLELGKALQVSDGTILLQKTSPEDTWIDSPDAEMSILKD